MTEISLIVTLNSQFNNTNNNNSLTVSIADLLEWRTGKQGVADWIPGGGT